MDADILRQLALTAPTPLARLAARAQNESVPERQHHNSYYIFELWLRMAAAVTIAQYRNNERRVASLDESLPLLVQPAAGTLLTFLQRYSRHFRDSQLASFLSLAINEDLARGYRWTSEYGGVPLKAVPTHGDFAQSLIAYRNKIIGHGALHSRTFYRDGGTQLFNSIGLLVGRATTALTGHFVSVEEVADAGDGAPVAILFDLVGSLPTRRSEPLAHSPTSDMCHGAVYFEEDARRALPLFPWLIWEDEFIQVMNGAKKSRLEYLNYYTGELLHRQSPHIAALRGFLGATSDSLPEGNDRHRRPGQWMGDYELLSVLGRGGMGTVFLARQDSTDMPVALKVLPAQFAADGPAIARFQREATILKRCVHPNIVSVLDSGEVDRKRYFVMELVRGCTLAELYNVLRNVPRDARARLTSSHLHATLRRVVSDRSSPSTSVSTPIDDDVQLQSQRYLAAARDVLSDVLEAGEELWRVLLLRFAEVADALAHLHERGVIHRDIKPANIMLTEDASRAVVMDLGIAKTVAGSVHTKTGTFVGTLRYASREQAVRSLDELTFRSDLYSLGATMYELFTLTPLYAEDESAASSTPDGALLKKILDERPVLAQLRNSALRAEISTILEKLLEKQPERRFYTSASALAEDLRSIYYQRPLRARDYTREERRAFELYDSLRAQAGTWNAEQRPRDLLWGEERYAEVVSCSMERQFELSAVEREFVAATQQHAMELRAKREARESADRKTTEELLARKVDAERQKRLLRYLMGLLAGVVAIAVMAFSAHRTQQAVAARTAAEETRNVALNGEARHLLEKARRAEREGRWDDALLYASNALDQSRDSELTIQARGTLQREAAVAVRTSRVWTGKRGSGVRALAFSPDGLWLAIASDQVGVIVSPVRSGLGIVGDGPPVTIGDGHEVQTRPRAWSVAFAPDGATLGIGVDDGSVELWDTRTWTRLDRWSASHKAIRAISFDHDSSQVFAGGDDGTLRSRMLGAKPGLDRTIDSGAEIYAIAGAHDGSLEGVARDETGISLLKAPLWSRTALTHHDGVVRALAFAGQTLLSGSDDGFVRLLEFSEGAQGQWSVLSEHDGEGVFALAATDDGTLAASAGEANAVHISDVKLMRDVRVLGDFPDEVTAVGFTRAGDTLAMGLDDGTIDIRRVEQAVGTSPSPLLGHTKAVENVVFWNGRLVSSGDDDLMVFWNLKTGRKDEVMRTRGAAAAMAARGDTLAVEERGGIIHLRAANGVASLIQTQAKDIIGLAISPDESLVAAGGAKGGIVLCDREGHCVRWKGHADRTNEVAFSPDGKWLASAGDDPGVILWRVAERRTLGVGDVDKMDFGGIPLAGAPPSFDVSFSHDGLRVAAGARDGTVRVWDTVTTTSIRVLGGSEERVFGIEFSPDDRFLASASKDSTVRVWDTSGWTPRVLRGHVAGAYVVRWSPDGKTLVSGGEDKTIRLWDTTTWTELGALSPRFEGMGAPLMDQISAATGLCLRAGVPRYLRSGETCAAR
jgi:WD40 repeat protein/serine/threonine protein kinase